MMKKEHPDERTGGIEEAIRDPGYKNDTESSWAWEER